MRPQVRRRALLPALSKSFKVYDIDRIHPTLPSPAYVMNPLLREGHIRDGFFVAEDQVVLKSIVTSASTPDDVSQVAFVRAGPRQHIFYRPDDVTAAIVTCGGIAPGINTVIRELVSSLEHQYGVKTIYGVPDGFRGFYSHLEESGGLEFGWLKLTAKDVAQIHTQGGTFLRSCRGGMDPDKIVDALERSGVNMLFIVGGDGTMRGGSVLYDAAKKRGFNLSVVGIPKTVDNDIPLIDKSFGFESAVEEAQKAVAAAAVEARSLSNGIGIVQLMGRNSGFIALHSTLASREVDCVLIPEVKFGVGELIKYVEGRLTANNHAVIVIAEGAGQEHVAAHKNVDKTVGKHDASGNKIIDDVGSWLSHEMKSYFASPRCLLKPTPTVKFINPTYMLRSVKANSADSVYCTTLAFSAVHGAMAGYTNFVVGPINSHNVYVPLDLIFGSINKVSTSDEIWARTIFSTGQPDFSPYKECSKSAADTTVYGGCTVSREQRSTQ